MLLTILRFAKLALVVLIFLCSTGQALTPPPTATDTSVPVPELSSGSHRHVGLIVTGLSALILLSIRKRDKK